MIEIGITRSTYGILGSVAHLSKNKIMVGTPDLFQQLHKNEMCRCFQKYSDLTSLIEGEIENLLTHETIHIILKKIRGTSRSFDYIDNENEISVFT